MIAAHDVLKVCDTKKSLSEQQHHILMAGGQN
jgi:hypothetical protein